MSALLLASSHVPVIAEPTLALRRDPVTLDTCRIPPLTTGCGTIRPVVMLNHILPNDEGPSSHQTEALTGSRICRRLPIRLADPSISHHQDYEGGMGSGSCQPWSTFSEPASQAAQPSRHETFSVLNPAVALTTHRRRTPPDADCSHDPAASHGMPRR
jgi:hypothetical protein